MSEAAAKDAPASGGPKKRRFSGPYTLYRVSFREGGQVHSAYAKKRDFAVGDLVMVKSDHGLEPALVSKGGIKFPDDYFEGPAPGFHIVRKGSEEDKRKYKNLLVREKEAFAICNSRIASLALKMKLISVERFFNGSKLIFYFTADNRVDFRELVKGLVQEFRTRVEMKQIGVRHETKMIGGLGCCGREFCCSSFIGKFAPVSIKMAKDQDLPLNPTKISGVCNRLLCCLTHEHATYKSLRKGMPKYGKNLLLDGKSYKIIKVHVLAGTITVVHPDIDGPLTLSREEWQKGVVENRPKKSSGERPKKGHTPKGGNRRDAASRRPPRKFPKKQHNPKKEKK